MALPLAIVQMAPHFGSPLFGCVLCDSVVLYRSNVVNTIIFVNEYENLCYAIDDGGARSLIDHLRCLAKKMKASTKKDVQPILPPQRYCPSQLNEVQRRKLAPWDRITASIGANHERRT